jgi:hypothetical protein
MAKSREDRLLVRADMWREPQIATLNSSSVLPLTSCWCLLLAELLACDGLMEPWVSASWVQSRQWAGVRGWAAGEGAV